MAFLLFAQQKDGTWDNAVESDAVRSYFSTLQAAMALSETKPVGFAPSVPELAPMLETHVNADVGAFVRGAESSVGWLRCLCRWVTGVVLVVVCGGNDRSRSQKRPGSRSRAKQLLQAPL